MRNRCAPSERIWATTSKQKCELGLSKQPNAVLTSLGAFAGQRHARRGRLRHQATLFVGDFTLHIAKRAAAAHHFALGSQASLPHGTKKIDLQLYGGKGLVGREGAGKGDSHGGIGNVAKNSAMQSSHGICVLGSGRESEDSASIRNFFGLKSYQPRDRNLICLYASHEISLMHRFGGHDNCPRFFPSDPLVSLQHFNTRQMQPIGLYSIEQWWVAHQRRKTCSSSTFQMRTNGKPLSKECEMQASIPSQRQSPTGIVKP